MSDPNATYCHQTACGSYLSKTAEEDAFRKCGSCNKETCTSCQMARHTGACLQDEAAKTMEDVAKEAGSIVLAVMHWLREAQAATT